MPQFLIEPCNLQTGVELKPLALTIHILKSFKSFDPSDPSDPSNHFDHFGHFGHFGSFGPFGHFDHFGNRISHLAQCTVRTPR